MQQNQVKKRIASETGLLAVYGVITTVSLHQALRRRLIGFHGRGFGQDTKEMKFFNANRYRILELIGKGNYRVMCAAVDTHTRERKSPNTSPMHFVCSAM
ncbi:hypothetical protein F2Q68_00017262 [Brassica cretica]|uniref:Uncharacterized protein n=1 Tax=Brassica cretica TaxID=69181 RepID=A0A8S9HFE1_BRACR|nr:hypothetical protein F2Q68_00017262 [Brassica cretica]